MKKITVQIERKIRNEIKNKRKMVSVLNLDQYQSKDAQDSLPR